MAEEADKDQKTEAPSQKRLDEARERGQVVASREVGTLFCFSVAALVWLGLAGNAALQITVVTKTLLAEAHLLRLDGSGLSPMAFELLKDAGVALALPALAFLVAPILATVFQNGLVWTSEPLQPKLDKLSPLAGLKRLFSAQTLAELVKSLLKIGLVGAGLGFLLWPERDAVMATSGLEAGSLLAYLGDLVFRMLAVLAVMAAGLAAADYGWQWFDFMRKMRMSKEEVREEHKQNEGDPHIKQKRRAIQIERSRRRMMADVPKATVVLMNPTHFAVALRYVAGETPAPEVVAKGVDALALKIRSVAEESRVPVIVNPPLARTLHAACEIGEFVPPEHYQAVAEVISYVLRLSEQQRG